MIDDVFTLVERDAPRVTDNDAVRAELHVLARSTRARARRSPRNRLWTIGVPAVSIALVLGGVTSAVASPVVRGWWADHVAVALPWLTGPNPCVNAIGVASDPEHPANPASLAAAKIVLRHMDFSKIQASAAYKTAFAHQEKQWESLHLSPDVVRYDSQGQVLDQMIDAKLRASGVDVDGIVITGDETCTDGTK